MPRPAVPCASENVRSSESSDASADFVRSGLLIHTIARLCSSPLSATAMRFRRNSFRPSVGSSCFKNRRPAVNGTLEGKPPTFAARRQSQYRTRTVLGPPKERRGMVERPMISCEQSRLGAPLPELRLDHRLTVGKDPRHPTEFSNSLQTDSLETAK